MLELLDPELVARSDEHHARFRGAAPFPHVVLERFFEARFCERLIAEFPPFHSAQSLDPVGLPSGKAVVEDLRGLGGAYARADELFRSPEFARLMSALTGIPKLLYDPDYAGGGTHENLSGEGLDPHVDFNYHPREGWHRRLNLIVYLNHEWDERWGGHLELHTDPWLPPEQNRVRRVVPAANRAVLFETSERSWHGVEDVARPDERGLSRKSLALYMYTEDRPRAETAPSHETVFVDRPLPFVLKPGRGVSFAECGRVEAMLGRRLKRLERLARREFEQTEEVRALVRAMLASGPLDGADVELLGRVFAREEALLRALYDREKEWSRDAHALKRRAGGVPLFGPVELAGSPLGFFAQDGWCEAALELAIAARAPASRLTLHGIVPERLGGLTLACTLDGDGRAHERAFAAGAFRWELPVALAAGAKATLRVRASASWEPGRELEGSIDERSVSFILRGVELA